MANPPWIRETSDLFKDENRTTGNSEQNRARYNSRWRKVSSQYFKGKPCVHPGCLALAELTDHIIPIGMGGAQWDRRNWQPLCNKHHDRKRGQEAHGKCEEWVDTPHGKIPKRNAHLNPDIIQRTYEQASKVLAAIHEADEIHAGRKKGKSFDRFLKEI